MQLRSVRSLAVAATALFAAACSAADSTSPRPVAAADASDVSPSADRGAARPAVLPIEGLFLVSCGASGQGELVRISGEVHFQFHVVTDGSGGLHAIFRASSSRLTGVGLTTGDTYHGSIIERDSEKHQPDGSGVFRFETRARFHAPGRGNDFTQIMNLRAEFDENGELVVLEEKFELKCR